MSRWCFIFHDVDFYPEDDRNIYSCAEAPIHFATATDNYGYVLPYAGYAGGVIAMTSEQVVSINGFSNLFWGWGGEDDDMFTR